MRLEKMFTNGIIEAVERGGLEPRECDFDFDDDDGCRITHSPSGSSFLKGGDFSRHTTTTVVGEGPPQQAEAFTWTKVEERAERWAGDVKRDTDTPDLWAELQRERDILTGARFEAVEDTPFTPDERAEIAQQLRQLNEFVKATYSLPEARMRSFEAKLVYLEAEARHSNRRAWRFLFLGVMLELIVGDLALPSEALQDILTMTFHGLQHVLDGGGPRWGTPPLLPPTP